MFDYFIDKKPNWVKLVVVFLVSVYFFRYINNPETWGILDSFNLLMHEAGHWIFGIFGETIGILGGSLTQILIPLIFIVYFFLFQMQMFSASVLLFWLSQNILNVARYVGDAVVMQLPLIGGESVIHDWNFLFVKYGLLHNTDSIANGIKMIGIITFICAVFFSFKYSFNETEEEGIIENV